jgi:hypothetical protein
MKFPILSILFILSEFLPATGSNGEVRFLIATFSGWPTIVKSTQMATEADTGRKFVVPKLQATERVRALSASPGELPACWTDAPQLDDGLTTKKN